MSQRSFKNVKTFFYIRLWIIMGGGGDGGQYKTINFRVGFSSPCFEVIANSHFGSQVFTMNPQKHTEYTIGKHASSRHHLPQFAAILRLNFHAADHIFTLFLVRSEMHAHTQYYIEYRPMRTHLWPEYTMDGHSSAKNEWCHAPWMTHRECFDFNPKKFFFEIKRRWNFSVSPSLLPPRVLKKNAKCTSHIKQRMKSKA